MQGRDAQSGHAGEIYRDTVWVHKDGIKKAKAHLKSNLVRDMMGNKEGFHRPKESRHTQVHGSSWGVSTSTERDG